MNAIPVEKTTFEVSRNLDVSTCHITEDDDRRLSKAPDVGDDPLSVYPTSYGFLVRVTQDEGLAAEEVPLILGMGYSLALVDLLARARKAGCVYLHLDSEGPIYPELPQFDW